MGWPCLALLCLVVATGGWLQTHLAPVQPTDRVVYEFLCGVWWGRQGKWGRLGGCTAR